MQIPRKTLFLVLLLASLFAVSCDSPKSSGPMARDQVNSTTLYNVRLGDGVPLALGVTTRWRVEDIRTFTDQFRTPSSYDSLVLRPRQLELASQIGNGFPSVDSVFSTHRQRFIDAIKSGFTSQLGENGISIKEVIVSEIRFPNQYTTAKEEIGMKEQELARIRQKNIVDLAQAEAAKKKAEADGQVAVVNAKQQGELQRIQSITEQNRRKIEMARAETERQVAEMQARAEARKLELIAKAEVKKQADLNQAEVTKKRDMEEVALNKQRSLDQIEFERQIELAKLCETNPTYASFLVNKELASKVQIAVLPNSQEGGGVFGNMLKQTMSGNGSN